MDEAMTDVRIQADQPPDETFVSLPALIRRHAAEQGEALALRCGDKRYSWRALGDIVERCAAVLRAKGFGPGKVLCILSDTTAEYMVGYLAGLSAGGGVAPLPSTNTEAVLARMASDADAAVFLAGSAMRGRADAVLEEAGLADSAVRFCLDADAEAEGWPGLMAAAARVETLPEPVEIQPDWIFNIIYSSGTTGVPKGIVHEHVFRARQVPRFSAQGLAPGKTIVTGTAPYSNITLVATFGALGNGAALVLQPKFDTESYMELIAEHRATHAMTVPVILQRILAHPRFGEIDLSSLERSFCTSAMLPLHLKTELLERWPGTVVEMYGLTEGGGATALDIRKNPDKIASVGQPALNADVRIIDDAGNELPQGETGEVVGRAITMMRGYFKRGDLTADALITLANGKTYFRSGDLGRFDEDGFLYLVGRKKDMIITGGFNVYASDLEDALFAHEAVADVAVVGAPSAQWGETPAAFVVLKPGATATAEELMAFANANLGKIQRITSVTFLDQLPRSGVGKILKRELVARFKETA